MSAWIPESWWGGHRSRRHSPKFAAVGYSLLVGTPSIADSDPPGPAHPATPTEPVGVGAPEEAEKTLVPLSLDYATPVAPERPAAPTNRQSWSPAAIIAVGTFLSWGPAGIAVAWIVGQIGGAIHEQGSPRPDPRMPAFMIGLMTWPVAGLVGTAVSVILGSRAERRTAGTTVLGGIRPTRAPADDVPTGPSESRSPSAGHPSP